MQINQDMLSNLPRSILDIIVSKISIKDAARCSVLSKEWRLLYTQMPHLILSPYLLLGHVLPNEASIARAENIISNILLHHSPELETFFLSNNIDNDPFNSPISARSSSWIFSGENVNRWVEIVAKYNIKYICIIHSPIRELSPPSLFSCTSLVTLKLHNCTLANIPPNFKGFNYLISCFLRQVELSDDILIDLITNCPVLCNLDIIGCFGLQNVKVDSSTIENIYIETYSGESIESVTTNCPNLKNITAYRIHDLTVNGSKFHELSIAVYKIQMEEGSGVSKLHLECTQASCPNILMVGSKLQSLKSLLMYCGDTEEEEPMEVPILKLIDTLPNLEELSIFGYFVQEYETGLIPLSLGSPHLKLKVIRLELFKNDARGFAVVSCLLRSTPALESMEIELASGCHGEAYFDLMRKILYPVRASPRAIICAWQSYRIPRHIF